MEPFEASIVMLYFSFTTLLTIGLGDFAPRGNYGRALASIGMLGGVMAFTIIKDNFIALYEFIKEVGHPLEEREELAKFFQIIKKFNYNILDQDIKVKLESYFEYRWAWNKKWALEEKND